MKMEWMSQNWSKTTQDCKALLNQNEYDVCTRVAASLLFCTVPELSSIRLAVMHKVSVHTLQRKAQWFS